LKEADRKPPEAAMQQYTTLLRTGPPDAVAASYTADGELLEPGTDALKGPAGARCQAPLLFYSSSSKRTLLVLACLVSCAPGTLLIGVALSPVLAVLWLRKE
jgi:hypothetical protein